MKFRATSLVAGALLAGMSASSYAQNHSTIHSSHNLSVASSANMRHIPPRNGLTRTDLTFMRNAAMANTAEVELGKLAQRNGSTWGRGFGRDMEREHTIALADLKQLAKTKGVSLPTSMDSKHRQLYQRLSRLHGQAFDSAYRAAMIKGHSAVLNTLHREIQNGHDSSVRDYAVMLEPGVKMHHKLAVNQDTMLHHNR